MRKYTQAFTIVELLVVIVVIGILAAITTVAYNGVTREATIVTIKAGLRSAADELQLDNVDVGKFPATLESANNNKGITRSDKFVYQYNRTDDTFCVTIYPVSNTNLIYSITEAGVISATACAGHGPIVATSQACFNFNAGTRTITGYYSREGNNPSNPACPRAVIIPATIGGVDVRTLGFSSFAYRQMTSVVIPGGVVTIEGNAFYMNQITSIVIPNSVTTIESGAFGDNQLPAAQAFIYARNSNGTSDTTRLVSYGGATRSGVVIPASVTTIAASAFANSQVDSVTLQNSVTTIEENAFFNAGLSAITIPTSVVSIGASAFISNALTSVSVPTATVVEDFAFDDGVTITRY
jgi:prepilin-type N-terminal cleavage/methylation domain-containing protein